MPFADSTRMAASEVGGCVAQNENNTSRENVKCVESEKKTENGKVHHGKNGYVKSTLITNGIHVSIMGYYFTNVIINLKKIAGARISPLVTGPTRPSSIVTH